MDDRSGLRRTGSLPFDAVRLGLSLQYGIAGRIRLGSMGKYLDFYNRNRPYRDHLWRLIFYAFPKFGNSESISATN